MKHRLPSGLVIEHEPPRDRSLLPLVLSAILWWTGVGVAVWIIFS